MVRSAFVFVHVTSAIGMCCALAIEGAVLLQILRVAESAQLRAALNAFRLVPHVATPSLLATILSGLYSPERDEPAGGKNSRGEPEFRARLKRWDLPRTVPASGVTSRS